MLELSALHALRFPQTRPDKRRIVSGVLAADFRQQFLPRNPTALDVGCSCGELVDHIPAGRKV